MGQAFQCDRCHEFKKGGPKATLKIDRNPPVGTPWVTAQLCEQCTREIDYAMQTVVRAAAS